MAARRCPDAGYSTRSSPRSFCSSQSPQATYLIQSFSEHFSKLSRIVNERGSVARDDAECNLNSIDFPEFFEFLPGEAGAEDIQEHMLSPSSENAMARAQMDLEHVARFERRCLDVAIAEMERTLQPEAMTSLRLFLNVTDAFSQVYLLRDLASRRLDVAWKKEGS